MNNAHAPSTHLSFLMDMFSRLVANHPRFWIRMGNLESALLADELAPMAIEQPVYICGLARGGSTLLLEILAHHERFASHRYQDFPFVFTPYWWHKTIAFNPFRDLQKRERAHGDGIMVNAQSPEAMEEMIWQGFAKTNAPEFERFYANHMRKIMMANNGKRRSRYLCKNNYNVTRMATLQRMFPDARFIIPVREPAAHIASLMRQHARFTKAGTLSPRALRHMDISGHVEFGLHRTPINTGDEATLNAVHSAWGAGDELRGWALYWNMIHRHIHKQCIENAALNAATKIVRFEEICRAPADMIQDVAQHAGVENAEALVQHFAPTIKTPDYYDPSLTETDRSVIKEITGETAALFGY